MPSPSLRSLYFAGGETGANGGNAEWVFREGEKPTLIDIDNAMRPRPSQGSPTLAGVYYRNFTQQHATQHFSTEICNNPISITLLSDPPYQGLITCDPDLAQSRKIPPPLTKLR